VVVNQALVAVHQLVVSAQVITQATFLLQEQETFLLDNSPQAQAQAVIGQDLVAVCQLAVLARAIIRAMALQPKAVLQQQAACLRVNFPQE
jgi:hypothetical protein